MQKQIDDTILHVQQSQFAHYDSILDPHRLKFEQRLFPLLSEDQAQVLLAFWLHFSSAGVGMTEPVEAWIRRAGERCIELNYIELGENLKKHARHEANHHLMMIKDTQNLVNLWNKHYTPLLQASELLASPTRQTVQQYQALHEYYIQSPSPFCQIAIEYEIENLSASYGMLVLKHTFDVLGDEIKPCLSFLLDHAQIDVAHTQFNRKVMSEFLSSHPETVEALIEAGIQSLNTYGAFISDCFEQAQTI